MKEIVFLVLALVAVAVAQIPLYTGHSYTGPVNSQGIYGPYGTYGPYGQNGPYGRIGTGAFGLVGNFGQGLNPSIYHIANSFFSKIHRRVETAYISPTQIPDANAVLTDAMSNFKICENQYITVPSIQNYKSCLQAYVNKAFVDISVLESVNQPANLYDISKTQSTLETRAPTSINSIKESTEIED